MTSAVIEIAFGEKPFDATRLNNNANWTDVTDSVRYVNYETSTRSDRFGVFSAGNAFITLNNRGRVFDPSYVSSPYVGEFLRNVPIRISGVHSSTKYVQWYGYVRTWNPGYIGTDAVTEVVAVDGMGMLAYYDIDVLATAAHGSDTSADRIGRVLDEVGFPAGYRDLDPGTSLQPTTFGVNALQHCVLAALSDGGFFYAQRDGTLTFDGMAALTTTRQKTSQVTLSHDTAPKYLLDSLVREGVGEGFRNLVRIGAAGVTTAIEDRVAVNDAPVVFDRTDLLMDSDAWADGLAHFYADLYATETPHSKQVTCLVDSVTGQGNTSLFPRLLRDRVTVEFDPPGVGADIVDQCFIDGMTGVITPARWDVTYLLSSADAYDDNLASAPSTWGLWGTDVWGTGTWTY